MKDFDIDGEDDLGPLIASEEFREAFRKKIEEDTWGKGLPKYYMDKEGWLVEHWKDGTINKIEKIK